MKRLKKIALPFIMGVTCILMSSCAWGQPKFKLITELPDKLDEETIFDIEYIAEPSKGEEVILINYSIELQRDQEIGDVIYLKEGVESYVEPRGVLGEAQIMLPQIPGKVKFTVVDSAGKSASQTVKFGYNNVPTSAKPGIDAPVNGTTTYVEPLLEAVIFLI